MDVREKLMALINKCWVDSKPLVDRLMDSGLIWPHENTPIPKYGVGDKVWFIDRDHNGRYLVSPLFYNSGTKILSLQITSQSDISYELVGMSGKWALEAFLYPTQSEAQTECDRRNGELRKDREKQKLDKLYEQWTEQSDQWSIPLFLDWLADKVKVVE